MNEKTKTWAVVPAGGRGSRMDSDIPKQYIEVCGQTIMAHTLARLCACDDIDGVVVGLSNQSEYESRCGFTHSKLLGFSEAGRERIHTVLNAILFLRDVVGVPDTDLVAVHDAARPCVTRQDIIQVVSKAQSHPVGAVLGRRVEDTIKYSESGMNVDHTVERSNFWRAFTPQVFRVGVLNDAIHYALEEKIVATDESMAMEIIGKFPALVEGHPGNIKITRSSDLKLAQQLLEDYE